MKALFIFDEEFMLRRQRRIVRPEFRMCVFRAFFDDVTFPIFRESFSVLKDRSIWYLYLEVSRDNMAVTSVTRSRGAKWERNDDVRVGC